MSAAAATWVHETVKTNPKSKEHLKAVNRADALLKDLRDRQLDTSDVATPNPVVSECHMHLDKITQWCPTVGLFLSNSVHIMNLEERTCR